MDNRYYSNVISEMQGFLDDNGFKAEEDSFVNDTRKISVKFDEEKQTYSLLVAEKTDDEFGEMTAINTWLFDDTQNAKDAESVGIDFVNSLRKNMGIRLARGGAAGSVELPSANKSGAMTVTGFTKKMLDIYPVLKDDYKEHVAVYGNFLYVNFFGDKLVPLLKESLAEGGKKQIKKLYDVFGDAYVKGDKDTVNIMIAILCAAAYKDEKVDASIKEMLAENSHFLQGYQNFTSVFHKSKKLFNSLVK